MGTSCTPWHRGVLFLDEMGEFDPVVLDNLRQQQALSLAYFDIFWLSAVLAAVLVVLVLLMKRSVAEKGEHVSAH